MTKTKAAFIRGYVAALASVRRFNPGHAADKDDARILDEAGLDLNLCIAAEVPVVDTRVLSGAFRELRRRRAEALDKEE